MNDPRRELRRAQKQRAQKQRAQKQLKALSRADRKFVGSHAYDLRKSTITENGDLFGIIYVDSHKPIPEIIPRLAEDVCSILISALDQVSGHLLLGANPEFNYPTCFPIYETACLFENSHLKRAGGLPQDQENIFESVQPYNRGNNYLSVLRELARADNQRPKPIVSTTSIINQIKLRGMISPSGNFKFIVDPAQADALETGAELLRIPLEEMVGEIEVHRNFKYWQVFGKSPGIAEGLPVVSTLGSISNEVEWVLDQFRPFLKD